MKTKNMLKKALGILLMLCMFASMSTLFASAGTVVVLDNCDDASLLSPGEFYFNSSTNDFSDKKEGKACYTNTANNGMNLVSMWRHFDDVDTKQTMSTGAVQLWVWVKNYEDYAYSEGGCIFELGSSIDADKEELEWDLSGYLYQNGWNLVTLPFSDAKKTGGDIDLKGVSYFRLFGGKANETFKMDLIQVVNKADAEPGKPVTPSDNSTTKPSSSTTNPSSSTVKPSSTTTKPSSSTTNSSTNTANPSSNITVSDVSTDASTVVENSSTDSTTVSEDASVNITSESSTAAADGNNDKAESGVSPLAIVLIVLGVLILVGGGIAIFFILKSGDKEK